jgi:uncharacterized protein YcbK (DUF882 family)
MSSFSANRRSFLKFSLTTAMIFLGMQPASAGTAGRTRRNSRLSLYNIHTGEKLRIAYRNAAGEYDPDSLSAINWILRCHYTNKVKEIDTDVIDYLKVMDKTFGGDNQIHIISGYRSPEYNSLLQQEGRGVAKRSMHLLGKAIDFFIPRVSLKNLQMAAVSLQAGGVGYYPQTGFVHIDSGNFRTW